jgi:ABC-type siderophore export system fused ATPase/permease subunit
MAQPNLTKLAADVTHLQTDMAKVGQLVDRLDITISKLTEVSTSLSQLMAVHEAKLTAQDIVMKQTTDLVEKRRVEVEDKVQQLHARISSGEKELSTKIENQYDDLMTEIKEMRAESVKQHNALGDRINTMEKWHWIVIGGAIVIGTLLSQFNFSHFFS